MVEDSGLAVSCISVVYLQTGTYSNGSACVDCPAGYYCPSASAGKIACASGYYQDSTKQTQCDPCPGGQKCLTADGTPSNCDAGFQSNSGESACTVSVFSYFPSTFWD